MSKKKWSRLWLVFMLAVITVLGGCKASEDVRTYEGANLKFTLPSTDWEITYRVVNDDNTIIELSSLKYEGGISLMACETDYTCAETIYNTLTVGDTVMGKVSDIKTENNLSQEGGEAHYSYKVKSDVVSDYWIVFGAKNIGEDRFILANACIYVWEEDINGAEKLKAEIEKIIKSMEYSEVSDPGKAEKAVNESTIASNVIGNYIKGGVDYDYSFEKKDVETKLADGCSYVYQTEMYDYSDRDSAQVYILANNISDIDGYGSYYYDMGLNFSMMPVGKDEYQTPEEVIVGWANNMVDGWKSYATQYQNGSADEMVTVGDGNAYYQHLSVDSIDYDGTPYPQHAIIYYGRDEYGFAYYWTLDISTQYADNTLNDILEELSRFYEIDLSVYGVANQDMTMAGKRVDEGQDNFVAKAGDPEIIKEAGFEYMGTTVIQDYDNASYSVLVPMCKDTGFSSYSASAHLHGVRFSISTTQLAVGKEMVDVVKSDVEYEYNYLLENSRDYRNLEMGEVMPVENANGAYMGIISEKAAYDSEQFYPYYEIYYTLRLEDVNCITIRLRLEAEEFDAKTNLVLKDIEKAYKMDLSQYYYNP